MADSLQTHIPTPQPMGMPPTQVQKKGGCSCCLVGCFSIIFIFVFLIVGAYFGLRYSTDLIFSDKAVLWTYQNIARPKIEQMLPPSMPALEKRRVMRGADATVKDFVALSPDEKSVMKKEALIALYYYSQNQVIPPEKIPHLMKFIEMHVNEIQNGPAENPRLIQ